MTQVDAKKVEADFITRCGIRRVLIVKMTSMGDVIHALPAAHALKRTFPFLSLHWVVEDRCAPLLKDHPLLDSVLIYPRQNLSELIKRKRLGAAWKVLGDLRRALRGVEADLSIDLQGLAKSALVVRLAGARYRLGWQGQKELSYLVSKRIKTEEGLHVVDTYLNLVESLGARADQAAFGLEPNAEERAWADSFLKRHGVHGGKGPLIGLLVGTAPPQKCWPLERHLFLMEKLIKRPERRVILLGDGKDRDAFDRVGRPPQEGVIQAMGAFTLRRLMAVIERCRLVIGGDSGPLHLAAAMGVPTLALFGGTDPAWTGPYGEGHRVIYKRLPCSPCFKSPAGKPYVCQGRKECMTAIEVEEVAEAAEEMLGRPRGKA
jgi:heptosyltransferase-1